MNSTVNSIGDALTNYWNVVVDFLPQLVAALVVLIIGLIVASLISTAVAKLLGWVEDHRQVKSFLKRWDIKVQIAGIVGKFIWWIVFLVFLSAAVQLLQVQVLTETINTIVGYTPLLFAAAVVAGLTLLAAHVVRGLVESALDGVGFKASRVVGTGVYVVLLVFGFTLAAAQLQLDMTLITANLTVIVAGIALAGGLAFGLGGREVAGSLLAGLVTRDLVKKGQKLTVDGVSGKVVRVTSTGVVLDTSGGEIVVSHSRLMK